MPKVSVIIPVYKTEKYLDKCLNSVISQTLQDIEIIVVNDASPDNSLRIIDQYASSDNRIKVISKICNEGLSAARNSGLNIATGEYIVFVDSDDWLEPEMYDVMYNSAEKLNADVVICDCSVVSSNQIQSSRFKIKNEYIDLLEITLEEYLHDYFFPNKFGFEVWNKMYRHSILKENKLFFEKGLLFGEDTLFNICFLLYGKKLYSMSQSLYYYLQREGSIMNTVKSDLLSEISDFINALYNILKCNNAEGLGNFPYIMYNFIEYYLTIRMLKEKTSIFAIRKELPVLENFQELDQCMRKIIKDKKTIGKVISTFLLTKRFYMLFLVYKLIVKKYLSINKK